MLQSGNLESFSQTFQDKNFEFLQFRVKLHEQIVNALRVNRGKKQRVSVEVACRPEHVEGLLCFCNKESIKYEDSKSMRSCRIVNFSGSARTLYRPRRALKFVADTPCSLIDLLGNNFYFYPIGVANLSGASLEGLSHSCVVSLSFSFDVDSLVLQAKCVVVVENIAAVRARRPPLPPPEQVVVAPLEIQLVAASRLPNVYVPRPRRELLHAIDYSPAIQKLQDRIQASVAMQQNAPVVYVANELSRVGGDDHPNYVQTLVNALSCGYSMHVIVDCLGVMCNCCYEFSAIGSKHDSLPLLCERALNDLLLV